MNTKCIFISSCYVRDVTEVCVVSCRMFCGGKERREIGCRRRPDFASLEPRGCSSHLRAGVLLDRTGAGRNNALQSYCLQETV
jgi:hypothetical protein